MKQKKQWQKPALIVLVRRKPEEAVLMWCKTISGSGGGGCWILGCGKSESGDS